MPTQLKVQDFFSTTITEPTGIPATGDFDFTVAVAPQYTNGFIVVSGNNSSLRDVFYFHNRVWNRIFVRKEWRLTGNKAHTEWEPVQINDTANIFNYFSDMISQTFFVEKTWWLTIRVNWWYVLYNGNVVTVSDQSLSLADNATNYIKYDFVTNSISTSTVNSWNIKAVVTTLLWSITNIEYRQIKEAYIDFEVTINWLLPSQTWNSGKRLVTNWSTLSWSDTETTLIKWAKSVNIASASTVNLSSVATGNYAHITGTTTINSFGAGVPGTKVDILFSGVMTLVHLPGTLNLKGEANIVTEVWDTAWFVCESDNHWRCLYYDRYNGRPIADFPPPNVEWFTKSFTTWSNFSTGDIGYMSSNGTVKKYFNNTSQSISFANHTLIATESLNDTTFISLHYNSTLPRYVAYVHTIIDGVLTTWASTTISTNSAWTLFWWIIKMSNDKVVFYYWDNVSSASAYLSTRSATISWTTLTLGAEVVVTSGTGVRWLSWGGCYVNTDTFAIYSQRNWPTYNITLASLSWTTITLGSTIRNDADFIQAKLVYSGSQNIIGIATHNGSSSFIKWATVTWTTWITVSPTWGFSLWSSNNVLISNLWLNKIIITNTVSTTHTVYIWSFSWPVLTGNSVTQTTWQATWLAVWVNNKYFTVFVWANALNYVEFNNAPSLINIDSWFPTTVVWWVCWLWDNNFWIVIISWTIHYVTNQQRQIIGSALSNIALWNTGEFSLIWPVVSATWLTIWVPVYLTSWVAWHWTWFKLWPSLTTSLYIPNNSLL